MHGLKSVHTPTALGLDVQPGALAVPRRVGVAAAARARKVRGAAALDVGEVPLRAPCMTEIYLHICCSRRRTGTRTRSPCGCCRSLSCAPSWAGSCLPRKVSRRACMPYVDISYAWLLKSSQYSRRRAYQFVLVKSQSCMVARTVVQAVGVVQMRAVVLPRLVPQHLYRLLERYRRTGNVCHSLHGCVYN